MLFCLDTVECVAQKFDSVHVYAVYMKSMYRVKIDKDLIKNEVDPIVLINERDIDSVYSILNNMVKGDVLKKLKSNQLEIRLCFEFFIENKIVKTVGVTTYHTMPVTAHASWFMAIPK